MHPSHLPGAAARGAPALTPLALVLVGAGVFACGPDPDPHTPRPVHLPPAAGPVEPADPAFTGCPSPAEPREVARADLQAFLDRGIPDLLGRVRTSPVLDRSGPGARFVGYRIVAMDAGLRCGPLGLVEGDLLVSVNGVSVETPDGLMEIWALLHEATRIEVDLVQGGAPTRIVIDVVDVSVRLDNDGVSPADR